MTQLEYFVGLLLLLLGLNLGYYEAKQGLQMEDLKRMLKPLLTKLKR